MLPQGAGTGSLHRFSLFSPAGLAVGLALKEMRYASRRFAPGRPAIWFPHAPFSPRSFGFDGRGHASTRAMARTEKPGACGQNATKVASGRWRRGVRPATLRRSWPRRRRPAPASSPGGMRPSPVPPILIACRTRCLSRPPELVQVRAGHAVGVDRGERVAALAGLDEERPCRPRSFPDTSSERRLPVPPTDSPRDGDHHGGDRDAQADVEHEHGDREHAPAARQVGLARRARAAREGDEDHDDAGDHERHERRSGTSIAGGTLPPARGRCRRRRLGGVRRRRGGRASSCRRRRRRR